MSMNNVEIADDEIHPSWKSNPELRAAVEAAQKTVNESHDTLELIRTVEELIRLKQKYGHL